MDVLVEWEDKTENIVCTRELECVDGKTFRKGKKVRMLWCNKYYYGIIKETETVSDMSQGIDSDDLTPNSDMDVLEKNEKK